MYFVWAFKITCWTALAALGWRFVGDGILLTIVGVVLIVLAIGGFLRCARFAPIMAIIVAAMTITSINSCTSKMSKVGYCVTQRNGISHVGTNERVNKSEGLTRDFARDLVAYTIVGVVLLGLGVVWQILVGKKKIRKVKEWGDSGRNLALNNGDEKGVQDNNKMCKMNKDEADEWVAVRAYVDECDVKDTDIVFDCPLCGKCLVISYLGAGLQINCVECGEPVLVPIPNGMELYDLDLDSRELLKQLFATRRNYQKAELRVQRLKTRLGKVQEAINVMKEVVADGLSGSRIADPKDV